MADQLYWLNDDPAMGLETEDRNTMMPSGSDSFFDASSISMFPEDGMGIGITTTQQNSIVSNNGLTDSNDDLTMSSLYNGNMDSFRNGGNGIEQEKAASFTTQPDMFDIHQQQQQHSKPPPFDFSNLSQNGPSKPSSERMASHSPQISKSSPRPDLSTFKQTSSSNSPTVTPMAILAMQNRQAGQNQQVQLQDSGKQDINEQQRLQMVQNSPQQAVVSPQIQSQPVSLKSRFFFSQTS